VTNRKPVRITNAHEDPRFYSNVEGHRAFHSITVGNSAHYQEQDRRRVGSAEQAQGQIHTRRILLLVLGAQAAVAIENTRLFQQSDLISEFVHELRTPLSSLSTATYLLLRPEMSQDQRDQIINNIHSETMRLNALASSFLDLARLESGRVQYRKPYFSLADLMYECKDIMSTKAVEDNIHLRVESPEGLPLR
jgi:signal transduction histidine kinase